MTSVEPSYVAAPVVARLGLLAAGLFVVGTNAFVIAGLLPEIATSLRTSQAVVSASITLYAAIVAVGSPAISILLARVDRTRLMAAGLVLIGVGTLVAATAHGIGQFDLGRGVAAVGGAALVPTATAAAPALAPERQRGRAIAIVALGFTLATAVGSAAGTAVAAATTWRLPLLLLAAIAVCLAGAVLALVRGIPRGSTSGVRARIGVLGDGAIVAALVATVCVIAGFNAVYVFSAALAAPVLGNGTDALAVLLLVCGAGSVLGNVAAGRLVDRFGALPVLVLALAAQVVVFAVSPLADRTAVGLGATFFVRGVLAFGAAMPLQHRLVQLRPDAAAVSLSWYSTAMYVGIALAPVIGASALGSGLGDGTAVLLVGGAVLSAAALLAVVAGAALGRRRAAVRA